MKVPLGSHAPDFQLKDASGQLFRLADHLGKQPLVIFFYPKDFTPGCTAEACSFRDHFNDFSDAGALVVGISSDSERSHQRFSSKYKLPYTLLSDPDGTVSKLFGIKRKLWGLMPGRETFVLDQFGKCIMHFENLGASGHVRNALNALKGLNASDTLEVYPLIFYSIFKERIWGGSKLRDTLHKAVTGESIGESWEISGVPGSESIVKNGVYAGRTLSDLCDSFPDSLLGERVLKQFGGVFPLLIKFIDARQDLSIQLHPNDEMALKRHNSFGKTEMWYIMDADPDAKLIVGFNRNVTPEEYQEALNQGNLADLLHYQDVKQGDTVFIPAGKIHAIGAGVLLAEIQQSSDVTYRVFDFNRRDPDGNLRELHTDLALEAMDFDCRDDFKVQYNEALTDKPELMVNSPYFKTRFLNLTANFQFDFNDRDAFTVLICVAGKACVRTGDSETDLNMGEALLIPAVARSASVVTSGGRFLEVTV